MQLVRSGTKYFGRAIFILNEQDGHSGKLRISDCFKHRIPVGRRCIVRQKQMQEISKGQYP